MMIGRVSLLPVMTIGKGWLRLCLSPGKQLALLKTNSAVRTCGFDFGGNIIMFSTDKQMGYQCFVSFFDLRDPSQIGKDWA